jgi:hypothetical protein
MIDEPAMQAMPAPPPAQSEPCPALRFRTIQVALRDLGDWARHRPEIAGVALAVLAHATLIAVVVYFSLLPVSVAEQSPPSVPVDLVTVADKTDIATSIDAMVARREDASSAAAQPAAMRPPQIGYDSAPRPLLMLADTPKPATASDAITPPDKPNAPATASRDARLADRAINGGHAMNDATIDVADALLAQIKPCWSTASSPNPNDLAVSFDLVLNPDGSVAKPPQLIADWANRLSDPYVRAAAEVARRAIYTCAPYRMPPERYAQWREINPLRFDPRQMGP